MNYTCKKLLLFCRMAVRWTCVAAGLAAAADGQAPAPQITAPANGTIVNPGQNLPVNVTVTAGQSVSEMIVIGEDPIGFSLALTSPPYQFTLVIPETIRAGSYSLVASALASSGQEVDSNPVLIDVEPSGTISSLQVEPSTIHFGFVGAQMPLRAIGMIGAPVDITASSMVSYSSQNGAVASVNAAGLVTATGSGSTTVVASAQGVHASVAISVPPALRGDLNGDGKVDEDDLNIVLAALNTPATKPVDARDLNGDGIINALDSRILVTLCSRPACATR